MFNFFKNMQMNWRNSLKNRKIKKQKKMENKNVNAVKNSLKN